MHHQLRTSKAQQRQQQRHNQAQQQQQHVHARSPASQATSLQTGATATSAHAPPLFVLASTTHALHAGASGVSVGCSRGRLAGIPIAGRVGGSATSVSVPAAFASTSSSSSSVSSSLSGPMSLKPTPTAISGSSLSTPSGLGPLSLPRGSSPVVGRTPALSRSVDTASEGETGPETAPSSFTPVESSMRSTATAKAGTDACKELAGDKAARTSLPMEQDDDDEEDGWIAVEPASTLVGQPSPACLPIAAGATRRKGDLGDHEDFEEDDDDEGELIFWNDADE